MFEQPTPLEARQESGPQVGAVHEFGIMPDRPIANPNEETGRKPDGLVELETIFGSSLEADQIAQLQRLRPEQRDVFLDKLKLAYERRSAKSQPAHRHMKRVRSFMGGHAVETAAAKLGQLPSDVWNSVEPLGNVLRPEAAAIRDAYSEAITMPLPLAEQPLEVPEPATTADAIRKGYGDITIERIQEPITAEESLPDPDESPPSPQQPPMARQGTVTSVAALMLSRRQAEQANRSAQEARRTTFRARLSQERSLVQTPPTPPEQALATLEANGSTAGWRALGRCASADEGQKIDPDIIFYPEDGLLTKEAEQLCSECTVRELCRQEAVGRKERFGTWGGLSEKELRAIHIQELGGVVRPWRERRIPQMVYYLGSTMDKEKMVIRELKKDQHRLQLFVQSVLERYAAGRPKTDEASITDLHRYFNGEELGIGWPEAPHMKRLFGNIVDLADFLTSGEHDLADPLDHFMEISEGVQEAGNSHA